LFESSGLQSCLIVASSRSIVGRFHYFLFSCSSSLLHSSWETFVSWLRCPKPFQTSNLHYRSSNKLMRLKWN
jgi:hypothetical protein